MRKWTTWSLLLVFVAGTVHAAAGTAGSLDTDFGPYADGMVTKDFASLEGDMAFGVAVQPDGKILVAGVARLAGGTPTNPFPDERFTVMRYYADGSLDTDFGDDGVAALPLDELREPGIALDVAVDSQGRIVAVGGHMDTAEETVTSGKGKNKIETTRTIRAGDRIAVVRFDANGMPDADFGVQGVVLTTVEGSSYAMARSVVILDNDDIVVAGGGDFASASSGGKKGRRGGTQTTGGAILARYKAANGALDPAFGDGGIVIDDSLSGDDYSGGNDEVVIHGLGLQASQDRLVTLCFSNVVRAYDVDTGAADGGFATFTGTDGDFYDRLEIDAGDGDSVLLCGSSSGDGLVTRLSNAGAWQWDTLVDAASFRGIGVDTSGKILVGASTGYTLQNGVSVADAFTVRLTTGGALDSSYGQGGIGERTTPQSALDAEYALDLAVVGDDAILVGHVIEPDTAQAWFVARYCGQ